jgi:ATP/maltotriose-dependent transcriptional regulator MalT
VAGSILSELGVPRFRLQRPRLPGDPINRPDLLARFDRGANGAMTLVCAPAGYGKSTAIASWLARINGRIAWLTLAEHDDTVPSFARALIAAIQTAEPEVGRTSLALLNAPEAPSTATLATSLADDLGDVTEPLIVVLDVHEVTRAVPLLRWWSRPLPGQQAQQPLLGLLGAARSSTRRCTSAARMSRSWIRRT